MKPAGSAPHSAACLSLDCISPNKDLAIDPFSSKLLVNDNKLVTIAANLTIGEVIWLLFELVLIVLKTGTDKMIVIYIEVALYKPPF